MKNYKIGKKLTVAFAAIILMLLITAAGAIIGLSLVGGNFKTFYTGPYEVTTEAQNMLRYIQSAAKFINYSFATKDEVKTKEYMDNAQSELDNLEAGSLFLKENFTGDQSLIDDFHNAMSAAADSKTRVFELAIKNESEAAAKIYFDEYYPYLVKALSSLNEINAEADATADDFYHSSVTIKNVTLILLILVVLAALAITIAFALYIIKSLTNPIRELEAAANKMADGDYEVELTYDSEDELGSLSQSMRKMIQVTKGILNDTARGLQEIAGGNFDIAPEADYVGIFSKMRDSLSQIIVQLSETMYNINNSSEQVAVNADQISQGAQSLTEGATDQAGSIEELQATVTDIAEEVNNNAQNSKDASTKAESVGDEIEESNAKMQDMLTAMKDISKTSNEISNIINTINDIATQTNLLALNASIEAARAGEAGKGFAVVADEVSKLASESAKAAKSTSDLVQAALNSIEKGMEIADLTAERLGTSYANTKELIERIEKISDASVRQASALDQISQGVDQIASVVEENTAMAEESSASSDEMANQAQKLQDLISQFKLLHK